MQMPNEQGFVPIEIVSNPKRPKFLVNEEIKLRYRYKFKIIYYKAFNNHTIE